MTSASKDFFRFFLIFFFAMLIAIRLWGIISILAFKISIKNLKLNVEMFRFVVIKWRI
jgi:hypothetical protein